MRATNAKRVRYHTILSIIGYYTGNKIIHNNPEYQNLIEPLIENVVNNIQSIPSTEGKITMYYSYIQILYSKDWGYTYRDIPNNLYENLKENEIGLFLQNNELFYKIHLKNALPVKIDNGNNYGISQVAYNKILERLRKTQKLDDIDVRYDDRKELLNFTSSQGYTQNFQDNVCQNIDYLKAKTITEKAKLLVDMRSKSKSTIKYSYDRDMDMAILEYTQYIQNFSRKRCSE